MKTVLIMGANGYIGSHLVKYLCDKEDKYRVIASGRKSINVDTRAKFIRYDIMQELHNETEFKEYFGEPDICVYLTWQDGFDHNAESHMKDLYYHWNFIKQMLNGGLKHLAVMGSFREYGNYRGAAKEDFEIVANNYYVLAKDTLHKAIQLYIDNNDLEVCFQWIRPFSVYGNDILNNSIFSKIMKWDEEGQEYFPCTDGDEKYDYIYIDDVVDQIEKIISQNRIAGAINCCTGVSTSLKDQIEKFICDNKLNIRPQYGAFERRNYDSDEIYGDCTKLNLILENNDAGIKERK